MRKILSLCFVASLLVKPLKSQIFINNPSTSTNNTDDTYRLGKVSIGKTSPIEMLDVNGNIALQYGGYLAANGVTYRKMIQTQWDATNGDYLSFYTPGASTSCQYEKLRLTGNGSLGIGTSNPKSKLDINNTALGSVAGTVVEWQRLYGSSGMNQDNLRIIHRRHLNGNNWYSSEVRIQKTVDAVDHHYISFKGDNGPPALVFGCNNIELMSISEFGKVSIGTQKQTSGPHTDAKLTIDGKTVTKSLYVTISGWADYVFEPNYKPLSLLDIEKFYLVNKHLPEIPSEKEVIENGIDVAEMNKLLLKKIEELTILMVEQEKRINKLENKK